MAATPIVDRRRKPKQRRSQETVDAILEATAQVLVTHGYEKASTNRIAKKAGVSVGSIYQYFGNKEALVTALAEDHARQMLAVMQDGLREHVDAPLPQVARAIVRTMVRAHAVDPELHRVLTEQVPRGCDVRHLGAEIDASEALLRAFLERRRDEPRIDDLDVAVFVIIHTVEGLIHAAAQKRPDLLDDGRLEQAVVELLLCYAAR